MTVQTSLGEYADVVPNSNVSPYHFDTKSGKVIEKTPFGYYFFNHYVIDNTKSRLFFGPVSTKSLFL